MAEDNSKPDNSDDSAVRPLEDGPTKSGDVGMAAAHILTINSPGPGTKADGTETG